jgi:hypothetical protein
MIDHSLVESLRKISLEFSSPYSLANPFFRLSKPSPENLRKYTGYREHHINPRIAYNLLRFPLLVCLQGAFNLLLSIVTYREWLPKQDFREKSFDYLAISQVTTSNQKFNADPLLGKIPQKVAAGQTLCMFYLNGTRLPRRVAQKSLNSEEFQNIIVNSKTLSPFETVKVLFENLKVCITILKLLLKEEMWTSEERLLLSEGLLFQLRRPTFANLVLMQRLIGILDSVNVGTLLFTLEGHAHEAALIALIKDQYPLVQIRAVQHAPIVPSQFGYFDNLRMLRITDAILCSGKITHQLTSNYLRTQNAACKDARILGSSKHQNADIQIKKLEKRKVGKILLLPEGTENSAIEFVQLLSHLSLNFPNVNFVLRLHPATRQSPKVARELDLKRPKNAIISEGTLVSDLFESACSIYRGSAAAIEGLAHGVLPIHFNTNPLFDLDPIFYERLNHPKCANYEQLDTVLKDLTTTDSPHGAALIDLADFFESYYAPLRLEAVS